MSQKVNWIAVAVLSNGKRKSAACEKHSELRDFINKVYETDSDATIYYAVPARVINNSQ